MQQWMELGNQSQACITIPESCGAQGGTISVWVKIVECPTGDGGSAAIITSFLPVQTGFTLQCIETQMEYVLLG